jgi:predicted methyltransferase MtxX (methanogen marker protein 4)
LGLYIDAGSIFAGTVGRRLRIDSWFMDREMIIGQLYKHVLDIIHDLLVISSGA